MALLNTYMQMFQMGLIDQTEVLKKSEIIDINKNADFCKDTNRKNDYFGC